MQAKTIRAADAKEVGVGNPAEETYRYPNQIITNKLKLPSDLSTRLVTQLSANEIGLRPSIHPLARAALAHLSGSVTTPFRDTLGRPIATQHKSWFVLDAPCECVCITAMNRSFSTLIALAFLSIWASGCVNTLEGNLKFGVPGKDTIVSRYERPYDQIKIAAVAVLKRNGTLVSDDVVKKVLQARIDTASVFVGIDDSEPKIVKVTVQARRGATADVDLASEIDKQIYGELITR